jgi:hypothetical protein
MPNRASDKDPCISEHLYKSRVNRLKETGEMGPIKQDSFLFDRKKSLHSRQHSTDGLIHGFAKEGWNWTRQKIGCVAARGEER